MSGKGKKKGSKSKESSSGATGDAKDKARLLEEEVQSLRRELAVSHEQTTRQKQMLAEYRKNVAELQTQLSERSQERVDITASMGRQYHSLQSELLQKIAGLDKKNSELSAQMDMERLDNSRMKELFQKELNSKQLEIDAVKDQLKAVNDQLERLVGRTVDRITKKLEHSSEKWRGEVPISPDVQKKLLDFKLGKLQL